MEVKNVSRDRLSVVGFSGIASVECRVGWSRAYLGAATVAAGFHTCQCGRILRPALPD
jgi:hypothetical protein